MYSTGRGVAEDYKEAARWYRKAANQGLANAQTNLGLMYANGAGVSKDYKEAAKWYQKAADQGVAVAQFNLAILYGKGAGVDGNFIEAHEWLSRAIAGTNDDELRVNFIEFLNGLEKLMTKEQVTEALKREKTGPRGP